MVLVYLSRKVQFEFLKDTIIKVKITYNYVVDHDEASNYETLTHFNAIDASVYVDGVSAEDSERTHVHFVENS